MSVQGSVAVPTELHCFTCGHNTHTVVECDGRAKRLCLLCQGSHGAAASFLYSTQIERKPGTPAPPPPQGPLIGVARTDTALDTKPRVGDGSELTDYLNSFHYESRCVANGCCFACVFFPFLLSFPSFPSPADNNGCVLVCFGVYVRVRACAWVCLGCSAWVGGSAPASSETFESRTRERSKRRAWVTPRQLKRREGCHRRTPVATPGQVEW